MNGDIPETVTKGMAHVFRRYGAHLAGVVSQHRNMNYDYMYLYLSQFMDTLDLQNKFNSNAVRMRERFDVSQNVWDTKLRKWYSPINDVCVY